VATLKERLMAKVKVAENGCWERTVGVNNLGYSTLRFQGKMYAAHRAAYEVFIGPIPEGLQIDHLCRNRVCVNPDHLEPVTRRENLLRGEGFSAQAARKTHCPQGHCYEGDNLYRTLEGHRKCRACHRDEMNRKSAENRALGLTYNGKPRQRKERKRRSADPRTK